VCARTRALQPDLAAVEKKFASVVMSAVASGAAPENKELVSAITRVRNEIAVAVGALQKVELLIALSTPTIEDGGNFGVGVQADVKKALSEYRTALKATMASYPEYYKTRADAADKCTLASQTKKQTKTETKSDEAKSKDGAKEPAEAKTVASTASEEVSSTKAAPGPDTIAHLVAIDVDMYFKLQQQCTGLLEAYLVAADVIDKNKSKTFMPRGEGHNPMTMF